MTIEPTGYWTFFCNPAKWDVQSFLSTNIQYDTYLVTDWQKEWFYPGQMGVLRVGTDRRTKTQLAGRKRLIPGIYGIIEVLSKSAERGSEEDPYWLERPQSFEDRLIVKVRYVRNAIDHPLLLSTLGKDPSIEDKYLLHGFQSATMPLLPQAFDRVISLFGGEENIFWNIEPEPIHTISELEKLEKKYANAVPEVKEAISKNIERGSVSAKVKEYFEYRCLICEQIGLNPISFKKPDGKPYVEAHHVTPVTKLETGTLGPSNLITVCANHHAQLHYGNSELIDLTDEEFRFRIDGKKIFVKRFNLKNHRYET